MTKNEVTYGETDLLSREDVSPEKAVVSISIRIEGDLLRAYKEMAAREGKGYQTLMKEKLREALASGLNEEYIELGPDFFNQLEAFLIEEGFVRKEDKKTKVASSFQRFVIHSKRHVHTG